ncbi:AT-hook motif nuclear-localized protein 10 isoform X2 [Cryptomeria japonica]|uniref:AT-hook motif nuclear-localized protein 10 isoform X2 n=1 Tax=Cryptomeria japonica TaxID=3369 RepID=UPI0027DA5B12|nr:AT-hook motif nuclear-localized protein 10 isoform X2 [Cryptomeria japonica]
MKNTAKIKEKDRQMSEVGDLISGELGVLGAPHSQNTFFFPNERGYKNAYVNSNSNFSYSHNSLTSSVDAFPDSHGGILVPAPSRPNPFPTGNANLLYSQKRDGDGSGSNSAASASFLSHLPAQQRLKGSKEIIMKKKRGRPRKYGNDLLSSPPLSNKLERGMKKAQMAALGGAGRGFTTHILHVATGEDVSEKILALLQHGPGVVCVLSAKGAIENVTLTKKTLEGHYEIHSLSGSFQSTEDDERPIGGLSVCFSGPDGIIMGGAVPGCLMAASPVQVIVGTFVVNDKKGIVRNGNGDIFSGTMSSPIPELPPPRAGLLSTEVFGKSRAGLKGYSDKNTNSHSFPQQIQVLSTMSSNPIDWMHAEFEAQMRSNPKLRIAEMKMKLNTSHAGAADIRSLKDKVEGEDEVHTE